MVQISVGWSSELQGSETDVVQGFVIDDHDFVGVLNELMDGESSVIWLNDGI